MATKYVRVSLEEIKKHLEHDISFDSGRASFPGEAYRYEYSLWCSTCQESIGNQIILKEI